jgi:hypothetical protein
VTALQSNPTPMPTVNFARDMVVLVAGGRMSPADEIHVDSAGVRREATTGGKQQNVLAILFHCDGRLPQFTRDAYPVEIVRLPRYAAKCDSSASASADQRVGDRALRARRRAAGFKQRRRGERDATAP